MRLLLGIVLLISILFESIVFPLPTTLIIVTLIAPYLEKNASFWAFAAGILLDFFSLRPIGVVSLYFLGVLWFGERYQQKFHSGRFAYQITFLVLVVVIYNLLFYKFLNLKLLVAAVAFGTLLAYVTRQVFPETKVKKRLAV